MFNIYKQSFQENNTAIWWGGETTYRLWDTNTMFLYIFVVGIVMLLGIYNDRRRISLLIYNQYNTGKHISYLNTMKYLRPLFFILLLILGFRHTSVGIDTIVYKGGIEEDVSLAQRFSDSTTEPFYKIIQHILHLLFDNGTVGIFLYSLCTLGLIYGGIKRYANNINIYICLLSYVCLYYFPSFNLLRISLAASIIFYNFHFIVEGNYKRFAIVLLITSLLHYSSIVIFFPFLSYLIYKNNKFLGFVLFCAVVVVIIVSNSFLSSYISLINRYSSYIEGNEASGKVGIMFFIDYLPCLLVCIYICLYKIKDQWADLMICFTSSALIIRMLAYYLTAAGRLGYQFPILTMILLPYWINYLKKYNSKLYRPMVFVSTCWALARLHIYFIGYLSTDGIMPYKFFWSNL